MVQSAPETIPNSAEYEQSITALNTLLKPREAASGSVARWRNRISLASIAGAMNVPVVIATYRGDNNVKTIATHGLDLMNNLACMAAACDDLCIDRVVVIPDTRTSPALSDLARHWPNTENCFLVGMPLRDATGKRVGSLCVMNNSRAVARSGISFRTLAEVGKTFAQTGQLQTGAGSR
jgi:hypothetical protein